jgi:hypothetical protein
MGDQISHKGKALFMPKPAIFSGFFIDFEDNIEGGSMDDFSCPKS